MANKPWTTIPVE